MTIVELVLFLAAAAVLYRLFRPLQRRLEFHLRNLFPKRPKKPAPVIDITDYSKKDKK